MKMNHMHPWGTVSDNKFEILFDTCKLKHDWKLTDVKTKKVTSLGAVHRFRHITRTCSKCGYEESTVIRKNPSANI